MLHTFGQRQRLTVILNYRACGYNTGYKVVTSRVHQTTHAGYKLSAITAQYTGYTAGYSLVTTSLVSASVSLKSL